jgi:chromosome segregation ATPase
MHSQRIGILQFLSARSYRFSRVLTFTTVMIGIFGGLAAYLSTIRQAEQERAAKTYQIQSQLEAITAANKNAERAVKQLADSERINDEMRRLISQLSKPTGGPRHFQPPNPVQEQEIAQLKAEQDALRNRLASLEGALQATPEKAVALPLLGQQVSDLRGETQRDIDSIHADIGSLFTISEWAIGLTVTLTLGLASLFLAIYRKA